eukprot:TRINITY_DN69939_c0_g1_i1.p1 TRINITY_DN69939_c0_g1~~TRINITY_DN69939_c0_g1_i1.p1  ORF type:complete len:152 (-),score=3.75 TRINITY_DN69939_c0_g1_i1:8-463(-)
MHHGVCRLRVCRDEVVACIMAFVVSGSVGMKWTHAKLGVVVLVLTLAQPVLGFMRPDKGTVNRPMWLNFHWALGLTVTVAGWTNCYLGLEVFAKLYAGNQDWYYILLSVGAGLIGLSYFGFVVRDLSLQFSSYAFKSQMITSVSRQRLVET